jgi:hypothetical protein
MSNRLYQSRDGRHWVDKQADGSYKRRAGHVIYIMSYADDREAVASAKRGARQERRRLA